MSTGGGLEDTICSVATPVGEGGIGIVRISGRDALAVAELIVRLRSGHLLGSTTSHTLHLADFAFPTPPPGESSTDRDGAPGTSQRIIDEGLAVYMKGPRSFTAEDVVELHCHGSGLILAQLCDACLAAGARLAQPGEFTKRAFLNGRLDLSQAEAVLDTIRAKSEGGLRIAQRQLRGELGREVDGLRTCVLTILAHVEAGIDFVEEDIAFIDRDELLRALQNTLDAIDRMLITTRSGRLLREGARVVIVGRPNVGKSSLLNRLLRADRAIVTDVPGTTRDVIEESVVWQGLSITLIDTAGIRETADAVEAEGIRRARSAQGEADLTLHVVDPDEVFDGRGLRLTEHATRETDLLVISKMDRLKDDQHLHVIDLAHRLSPLEVVTISSVNGLGLDRLKSAICDRLMRGGMESDGGITVANVRHRRALQQAREALAHAREAVTAGIQPECVAVDLRAGADSLGEITGAITSDEVLERIFSEFCIGK